MEKEGNTELNVTLHAILGVIAMICIVVGGDICLRGRIQNAFAEGNADASR